MLNQQYQEPWVAIVVDPIRTMSAGKVNLGAFRTYPKVGVACVGWVWPVWGDSCPADLLLVLPHSTGVQAT